jgi:DNA invertase Pin-like site-specific DNA recombinase
VQVALYARVSTSKQDAENQLLQLRGYAQREGWQIYDEFVDVTSGANDRRLAWDALFRAAHMGLFDAVLFWSLDRFSRSGTLFTLQKLKELENCKVEWVSYTEPYMRSLGPFRDVVISIMATLAKVERERLSERTKAGLVKAKNVGKRGPDKRPRRRRSDRGEKRGVSKKAR